MSLLALDIQIKIKIIHTLNFISLQSIQSQQTKVYSLHRLYFTLQSTVYIQSTVYSLQSTVYSLQSTVYSLQSKVYSLQSTVFSLQSTVYSLQLKLIGITYNLRVSSVDIELRHCSFMLKYTKLQPKFIFISRHMWKLVVK